MSDRRKNLQLNQQNIEPMPEGNGWPKPLTDPSDQLRIAPTEGKSGSSESRDVASMKRSNVGPE